MTILSWVFIGCFSAFFISVCLGIFSFAQFFVTTKEMNELNRKRPKKKVRRKRWLRAKKRVEQKKKAQLRRTVVLVVISLSFAGSGFYARHYEMTNLSSTDGNIIVQSYFITDEVNKNLVSLQNGASGDEIKEKLMELSSLLASYGSATPSNSLSKEGQQALNRYYVQLRDYGTNLYSLTSEQLNNQETIVSYMEDLNRIKKTQTKLFKQFSVDEAALKQKK
ncbi:hypothetical protein [Enterococcus caccae]|uniref:Uncharacterized protein n=1 Tax=Enterococcus caccae ATCC BAA-1240 TaxID=1158612 RepID=R3WRC5_9ENTE|nr:hypothetical protein [Enterococcus caccae]EOL49942.1 hypothetical protein UC7_00607 [Enterococcus caccae ATCC BAA-1240]EOT56282.1 hypothetical protein I580_03082 [Enterococcus caccae ATCC BAA-1240]OJG26538.1 hypothetical protein RU98_GL000594 [Enterococcus caccae]